MSVDLAKLRLIGSHWQACAVKDNEPGTGGSLVNGTNEAILQIISPGALILNDGAVSVLGGGLVNHGFSAPTRRSHD